MHRYEMLYRGYQSRKNNVIIRIVMLLMSGVVNTAEQAGGVPGDLGHFSLHVVSRASHATATLASHPSSSSSSFFPSPLSVCSAQCDWPGEREKK